MQVIEITYIILSVVLTATGFAMVGLAMQVYLQAPCQSMLVLSVGFSILVAAAFATTFSAFLTDFENSWMLLTVN